jgi:antirestriction protein
MTDTPKIFVRVLSDYNNNIFTSAWIDAAQDEDDIYTDINALLLKSRCPNIFKQDITCGDCGTEFMTQVYPTEVESVFEARHGIECSYCGETENFEKGKVHTSAEEWAIHEYEGFHGYKLDEYESIKEVSRIGLAMEQADEDSLAEEFAAFLMNDSFDTDDIYETFRDAYHGTYDSCEDYAYEYLENNGDKVPSYLVIDYDATGRDLLMDATVLYLKDGGLAVFMY